MSKRDEILNFLNELLEPDTFHDYGPNGLQVEGKEEIVKVATAVSANQESFEKAIAWGADMILVHHGLFWDRGKKTLTTWMYRRVKALIDAGVNLVAYHLPLDAHLEVGNNAQMAVALGLEGIKAWDKPGSSRPIGVSGHLHSPLESETLFERARAVFGEKTFVWPFGPKEVKRGAMISGGGAYGLEAAIDEGFDFFVSGEGSEPAMGLCKEAGVHFIVAGHYASERLGVQALAKKLEEKFGLETSFIDVPNPF